MGCKIPPLVFRRVVERRQRCVGRHVDKHASVLTVVVHSNVVKIPPREEFSTGRATDGRVHKPIACRCPVATDEALRLWKCCVDTAKRVVEVVRQNEEEVGGGGWGDPLDEFEQCEDE